MILALLAAASAAMGTASATELKAPQRGQGPTQAPSARGTTRAQAGSVRASPAQARALAARGLDVGDALSGGRLPVVVRTPADRRVLRAAGLRFRAAPVVRAGPTATTLPSGRTTYRDLPDYAADLRRMVAAHPTLARLVTIGTSAQGRPIEGVEIAAGVNRAPDGRPTHVELGLHHAREWSSGEVVVEYGLQLLQGYRRDPRVTRLVRGERTFLFPVVNPDGFQLSRTSVPLQRKNANGVDLNRNYGAFWGGPGASDNPTSDLFRGPAPFSEPESQAVRDWSVRHQVIVLNSNHNYAGQVLYQPGFSRTDEPGLPVGSDLPGSAAFTRVARRMAEAAGYDAMPAYGLYDATGATEDFNYFAQGTLGYTTEIGYDAFQPDYQDGVVDQYTGTRDGSLNAGRPPAQGLGEAFLRAGEAALSRSSHGTITGVAPPGATLTLTKDLDVSTSYVLTGTDTPLAATGDAAVFPVRLESELRVPASGRFTWAVNPSTPPLTALAGRTQAWTLTCGPTTRAVTLELGEAVRQVLPCGRPDALQRGLTGDFGAAVGRAAR